MTACSRFSSLVLLCGAIAVCPAVAQEAPAPEEPPLELAFAEASDDNVAWAEERGRLLYQYDQAAWQSSLAFMRAYDSEALGQYMRGYVVVPGAEDGTLDAIYYGDFGAGNVEVARYSVAGTALGDGGFHPADARPALSPLAERMAAVRQLAVEAAMASQLAACSEVPANTIVLPAGEGEPVDVYFMTPVTSPEFFPLGGHYRVTVREDKSFPGIHSLEKGCPQAPVPALTGDGSQILIDPVPYTIAPEPSEVHVFASYLRPMPIFVDTPRSRTAWRIEGGKVEAVGEASAFAPPEDRAN